MNIIFDPVFIFVFKWGMMGAAIATVMGQILTTFLAVWYLFHMNTVILIAVGMAAGCIPIVGCNIGAGHRQCAKSLFTLLLTAEASVGAVAFIIVELFPQQLISVFGVGFALLLPVFWGLDGVLYSMPVSDILTFLIATVLIRRTYTTLS